MSKHATRAAKQFERDTAKAQRAIDRAADKLAKAQEELNKARAAAKALERDKARRLRAAELQDRKEELQRELDKVNRELAGLEAPPAQKPETVRGAARVTAKPSAIRGWRVVDEDGERKAPAGPARQLTTLTGDKAGGLIAGAELDGRGVDLAKLTGRAAFTLRGPKGVACQFTVADAGLSFAKA